MPKALGRASGKRLPPMAEPIGERMTRVETTLVHLKHGQDEIVTRLDSQEASNDALIRKLDMVLANQATNADKTQTSVDALKKTVDAMKPDVQTVADLKKMGSWGKAAVVIGGAVLTTIATAKGWLIFNWNFFFGK